MTVTHSLEYAPSSEQEVVVLFALLLQHLPKRFMIQEVRESFPDCLAWQIEPTGQDSLVRIEFELNASNFIQHGHDFTGCDLIVCWEDDLGSFPVPRLSLREVVESLPCPPIKNPDRPKYQRQKWAEDSFLAAAPESLRSTLQEMLTWAKSQGDVSFGAGDKIPSWSLSVRGTTGQRFSLFGVYADGRAWPTSVSRLPPAAQEVFRSALGAVPSLRTAVSAKDWFMIPLSDRDNREALRNAVDRSIEVIKSMSNDPSG